MSTIPLPPDEEIPVSDDIIDLRIRRVVKQHVHYEYVDLPAADPPAPSLFLNETWDGTRLWRASDPDAQQLALAWTVANDPTPERANASVVNDPAFGHALELYVISPIYGQTYGVRVFPTHFTRWDTFAPYVGRDIWLDTRMRLTEPLRIHTDGRGGQWLTLGWQSKGEATGGANALFQMNWTPDGDKLLLNCVMPDGQVVHPAPYFLDTTNTTPIRVTMRYRSAPDATGEVLLYFNNVLVARGKGRTGHKDSGAAMHSPTLYGNVFDGEAAVRFDAVRVYEASPL